VRALTTSDTSRVRIYSQPLRARRYAFSDRNPLLAPVVPMAAAVRAHRHPAAAANPLLAVEKTTAELVTHWIDAARDVRDAWLEACFFAVYSSPLMRAIGATESPKMSAVAGTDLRAVPEVRQALAQMTRGNYAVAVIRMLILLARSRHAVRRDRLERANELLTTHAPFAALDEATRTRIIHQQTMIAELEPEQALVTLPALLKERDERVRALKDCEFVSGPAAEMGDDTRALFDRMHQLLEVAS
jgi:hypothetical protein